ncbi:MAG: SgcJ/EcaC family oxidoreductase [Cyclobacteriaceae bacterium]|nr:SgcJ/EcaC family oxidoreductase [Cyclobacteriaceae bacterium]
MKPILYILVPLTFYSCSGKVSSQADEEAVREIVLDFQDDFNEGSFLKAETYTTNDWIHIHPLGGMDIGREPVLRTVREVHQSFLKGITMTTDSMQVRFIKPDVALVIAYHTIDDYITPDNVKYVNQQQIKSYIIIKENNKWLMAFDHNTIVQRY